jgi:hypothetical protein
MQEFKEGDRVLYRPVGGAMQTSVGVIKKILTHPEEVGSRHTEVKATEEMPRYVPIHKQLNFTYDLGH